MTLSVNKEHTKGLSFDMNKLFLLFALTTAHISLNASHAAQTINRPQGKMGLPTLCVGDRFIASKQSDSELAVSQTSLNASQTAQTHVTNAPRKSFVEKLGIDEYRKYFYDKKGNLIKWIQVIKDSDGYHGFSKESSKFGECELLFPEEAPLWHYHFRTEFNAQEQQKLDGTTDNYETKENKQNTETDTRSRCEKNGCFPGCSCP